MGRRLGLLNMLVLFLILITAFSLIFPLMNRVRFEHEHDEGWYLAYADFIKDKGLAGFRRLFTGYIANEERWTNPNPLRIFFIFISSIFVRLFGSTFFSIACLSFFSYLLFIAVNYIFSREFYGIEKAFFLTLLVSFSPINMAMSRRALLDSMLTLFLGLSIWLFLFMMHKDKRTMTKLIFSGVFALTILTRETSVLLAVPFIIYMLIYKIRNRENVKLTDFLYVVIYPALVAGVVWLFLSGGISNLMGIARVIFNNIVLRTTPDPYARMYGDGPWFRYFIDYMLLSPWTVILFIGYVFNVMRNPSQNDMQDLYFLIVFLNLLILFNFFTKNVRYVMILDMPIRLFSVLMLDKLIWFKRKTLRFAIIGGAVLLICANDSITFCDIFVTGSLYDPMSMWLLGLRKMIPL